MLHPSPDAPGIPFCVDESKSDQPIRIFFNNPGDIFVGNSIFGVKWCQHNGSIDPRGMRSALRGFSGADGRGLSAEATTP
jgi:hypothetical protein